MSIRYLMFLHAFLDGMATTHMPLNWLKMRANLTTENVVLDDINLIVLWNIPGNLKMYMSADNVENEDENLFRYGIDMLNTLSPESALKDHMLSYKEKPIVMLPHNLDHNSWLVNETRSCAENMTNSVLFLPVKV